jgi:hypothetical protein
MEWPPDIDDIPPNDDRDELGPKDRERNGLNPNEEDPPDEANGADDRTDRMKVEEPTDVGLVDIVSTRLAWFTAAVPIRGPIEVERDASLLSVSRKRSSPAAVERLDRNICVDVGSVIAAG